MFKAGDRVKVIKNRVGYLSIPLGAVGSVVGVAGSSLFNVRLDEKDHTLMFFAEELDMLEESVMKELKELKEGMVVRCITDSLKHYEQGEIYSVGYDYWEDFGVLKKDNYGVRGEGCFRTKRWHSAYERFSWDNFELVSDPEEEDSAFTMVEVPHYKGEPLVKVSKSGEYEMFKYQSGASGIVIRKSDGEVVEFNGVTALEF